MRLEEATRSAQALGVARVEWLGYADSGSGPEPEPDAPGLVRFSRAPVEEAAERLAAVLRTERADLLISYDPNGGYGHRDHVRVHEVGARAAVIAAVQATDYQGAAGPVTFDEFGDTTNKLLTVYIVEGDTFVPLETGTYEG